MMNFCEKFNEQWQFIAGDHPLFSAAEIAAAEQVGLPHTAVELDYNYFDETSYQRPFSFQ